MANRRDYGTGTIVPRKNGGYLIRWSEGMDPITGKHVRRSKTIYGTKTAANRELQRLTALRKGGSRLTVGELVDLALPALRIGDDTREVYRYALKHLPDATRGLPAADVTPAVAARVLHGLEEVAPPQTLRKLYTVLMACWRHARSAGWLDGNPWSGHRLPPVPVSAGRALTRSELDALLAACEPGVEALWIRLLLVTGARPGEIRVTRWSALSGDVLSIWGSKTGKMRSAVLDPETVAQVRHWQTHQRERALAAGVPLDPDPVLISKDMRSAEPWSKDYAGRFRWPRLRERAGIEGRMRLYDLRHTTVSTMQADGHDAATVAGLVGNNPSMTLRTYSHSDMERKRAAVESMAGRLDGTG